jgi:hypothetical protein
MNGEPTAAATPGLTVAAATPGLTVAAATPGLTVAAATPGPASTALSWSSAGSRNDRQRLCTRCDHGMVTNRARFWSYRVQSARVAGVWGLSG